MSVQTEIDRIITAVQAAHEKVVAKGGTTAQPYLVGNLESAIDTIPTGSDPVLQTKTVTPTTAKQTIKPDSGYDGLSQVDVNAMPTATQATPSITVSSSGLITASARQSAGYVASGTKSATKQLTTQAAKSITPSTSIQTAVASGRYTTGVVTVAPIPSNYEDVTEETNAYTDKIASLESAVTTLENELQGKASGGGSGGGSVETCTVTIKQVWGMNDDPELLKVHVFAYNIENGTVSSVYEMLTSAVDCESQHSISITVYKNTPITIFLGSISTNTLEDRLSISEEGGVATEIDVSLISLSSLGYTFTPTASTAMVTFASP